MTPPDNRPKRILIGAGSFADALSAIRLAERLAGAVAAEMGGILVEETIMADIAGMPGQRVVTTSGTLVVAPSRQQMQTLFEGDSRAFRQELLRVAQRRTVKCSFERRSGELISGLCDAARGWDLLLLGYRAIHRRPGRVVLIAPPGNAAQDARALAEVLATALGAEVTALALSGPQDAQGEAPPVLLRAETEEAMLALVGRMNAAVVVVDLAAGPLHTHEQLRQLLGAARCPVMVLGASQAEPAIAHSTQIPPPPNS